MTVSYTHLDVYKRQIKNSDSCEAGLKNPPHIERRCLRRSAKETDECLPASMDALGTLENIKREKEDKPVTSGLTEGWKKRRNKLTRQK